MKAKLMPPKQLDTIPQMKIEIQIMMGPPPKTHTKFIICCLAKIESKIQSSDYEEGNQHWITS